MADKKNEGLEQAEEKEVKPSASQNSVQLAVIGGLVGAGLGLLSSPGTGKRVAEQLGKSEVMKLAGRELRATVQDMVREQATTAFRQAATGYLGNKAGNGLLKLGKGSASSDNSDQYDELKEETDNLNERLSRIEEKLDKMLEAK